MSANALSMSLDDIIKSNKKGRTPKSGRGGKFVPKNKARNQYPRGRQGGTAARGKRVTVNKIYRGGNSSRGRGGLVRGRKRPTAAGLLTNQQYKRVNNTLSVKSPRNRQRIRNSDTPTRVPRRAQRVVFAETTPARYFKNVWRSNVAAITEPQTTSLRNVGRVGGLAKAKGKRTVQKLAQKKVQKARLVLTNRKALKRQAVQVQRTTPSILKGGIRRNKFGFVTVRSRNEKRIERLTIQEKINRATLARNRKAQGNDSWQGSSTNATSRRGRNGRGRGRGQVSMSNSLVQVRIPNDFRPQFEIHNTNAAPNSSYGMYPNRGGGPPYGRSNYDLDMSGMQNNMGWSHSRHVRSEEFEMSRGSLDPDIQRKISFIQSRTAGQNTNVLPDFRAPVSTSQMKLSDRFRMFMH